MEQQYSIAWLQQKFDAGELIKPIYFWGHTNKYNEEVGKFCFSQWYHAPFMVAGVTYNTAEHWMMAHKALLFDDADNYKDVVASATAKDAKELGRRVRGFDENLWNKHRYEIVVQGNIHKFNQHPTLAKYLLDTEDGIIVEASPVDAIWGIGLTQNSDHVDNIYNWRGLNLLGFALMEVRDFIKHHGHFQPLNNTMLPPWLVHPGKHYMDMFWRMGVGEEYMFKFGKYWSALTAQEQNIYKLTYPVYNEWLEVYE